MRRITGAGLALCVAAGLTITGCSSGGDDSSSGGGSTSAAGSAPAAAPTKAAVPTGDDKGFCRRALEAGKSLLKGGLAPGTPEYAKAATNTWLGLVPTAPASIRADVQQIADAYRKGEDPQAMATSLREPLQRYQAWGEQHCQGIS
ncbi:hypothetical protein J4573_51590 [Actinomadura barringtoniae]|uniref:Lipoprotein n=1 Tax=Actinomadura barringtoniae TaxID=1427535 RepID=A0A939PV60_9ACTN|nr:hypothetical protein [Actinomadura barringtoniae]MBO2455599.1 hypothetical protein [Actinomadura barringtoniae]